MSALRKVGFGRHKLNLLSGNGMHRLAQASWMLYVMSHCQKGEWHNGLPPKRIEPPVEDALDVEEAGDALQLW